MSDESLRVEYEKDLSKVKKGFLSKSRFNHMWKGSFNDDIEHPLIQEDWFDACVDAHKKLGFEARGAKIVTHDPADIGKDDKSYAMRHGVVDSDFQDQWWFYSCRQHRVHDNDRDTESLGALENVSVRTGVLSSFVYGPNSS